MRLQEEIIKQSDDESIFAWKMPLSLESQLLHGLLANSPRDFATGGGILQYQSDESEGLVDKKPESSSANSTWTMTNRGLSIRLPIVDSNVGMIAVLGCHDPEAVGFIGIRLQKAEGNQYGRVDSHRFERIYESGILKQLFIPQTFLPPKIDLPPIRVAVHVRDIMVSKARNWHSLQKSDYVITVRKHQDHILLNHSPGQ